MAAQAQEPQETSTDSAPANDGSTHVLVYGSLKRGRPNHGPYLNREGATFVGFRVIAGPYVMLNLGAFPGVVNLDEEYKAAEPQPILCELYKVDVETLHALDCLEGHPNFYERKKVKLGKDDPHAWVYFLPPDWHDKYDDRVVESGIWDETEEEQKWIDSAMS